MRLNKQMLASQSATSTFVLLWGSAAIFTRWGLDNASPIALLILRFSTALIVLSLLAIFRKRLLPKHGTRKQVLLTVLLMIAGYSICYFKAMAHGVTPGLMATIMGIQPILTLCIIEKNLQKERLVGLCIALAGLILGLIALQVPQVLGVGYAAMESALLLEFTVLSLIIICVAKVAATSICLGFGLFQYLNHLPSSSIQSSQLYSAICICIAFNISGVKWSAECNISGNLLCLIVFMVQSHIPNFVPSKFF